MTLVMPRDEFELVKLLLNALGATERGETVDLGSFAQYADDGGE